MTIYRKSHQHKFSNTKAKFSQLTPPHPSKNTPKSQQKSYPHPDKNSPSPCKYKNPPHSIQKILTDLRCKMSSDAKWEDLQDLPLTLCYVKAKNEPGKVTLHSTPLCIRHISIIWILLQSSGQHNPLLCRYPRIVEIYWMGVSRAERPSITEQR